MNIKELPDKYKIFDLFLSTGKLLQLTGEQKNNILASKSNMIQLEDGGGFNKAFIVSWNINMEETRKIVQEHKQELENSLATI